MKKNILIIGGSGELGSYLVKSFVNNNNLIVLTQKKKNVKRKKIKNLDFFKCDLSNYKEIVTIIKKLKLKYRKIDILIFVSAIHGKIASFDKIEINEFRKVFQINFFSFLEIIKLLLNNLKKSTNASIIVFSGGGVTFKRPLFSAYSTSKIALIKLIEIISSELKKYKININAISPGVMNSKLFRQSQKIEKKTKIKFVDKSKILNLINFLVKKNNKIITGKLLSAQWDDLSAIKRNIYENKNIYTLQRIVKKL